MASNYPKLMIYLHWTTLILVLTAYFTGDYPPADGMKGEIHVLSGIILMGLVLFRLLLRIVYRDVLPQHNLPFLLHFAASSVQVLLYLAMIFTPIAGYFTLTADVDDFMLFGWALPYFSLDFSLANAHELLAHSFLILVGLHAGAALFHHFVLKDNVLKSMSPH
ncbi:cytochrome b [Pasteurella sp. P03HT]